MTKQEAIVAMQAGKKVTHSSFCSNEFIYIKDGNVQDENGNNVQYEFWLQTDLPTGWSIYLP